MYKLSEYLIQELENLIENVSGFDNVFLETGTLISPNNSRYITIESNDLIDQIDKPANMFTSFKIEGSISVTIPKEKFWLPLHYRYDHPSGGKNSYSFLDVYLDVKKERWIVLD